ncbi:TonB-dependent receptor plug domain-containing protein [Ohtaekwangia koreensis]|uniref:TonB-dependent Receptor Plug Domain n=1 Tax=Ohtaekwangia koreensis TaxID=688867 RepID=A0A1T5KF34_9BACT|nr:TonB-dependent receptor [Ohtaekwangia koreensis]SKC62025.1 TonB-dependent Receptor Plug Domain [Ohtaekwangia koreensis]
MKQLYIVFCRKVFILPILCLFVLSGPALVAQENVEKEDAFDQELYDMSLEDLLHVKIVTASKSEETVRDAPAVVSIVTAKEIESYGAASLAEVLDRVAGLYMTGSFLLTNNMPTIRGETNAVWSTKVLVLINGRPYRDSYLGGNQVEVFNAYPPDAVERVEVIRGPGSVLYGTNAFTGVINVILKKSTKNNFRTTTCYGSFNTRQTEISAGVKHNDLVVDASINFYNTDGWKFTARDENAIIRSKTKPVYDSIINPARTIYLDRTGLGAVISSSYKGFTLNTFYGYTRAQPMSNAAQWLIPVNGGPNATPIAFEVYTSKLFADLGYSKDITPYYSTAINVTFNRTAFDISRADFKNKPVITLSNDVLTEWSNILKFRKNLKAIVGLVMNNQRGNASDKTKNADGTAFSNNREFVNSDGYYFVPDWNETWYSGYAQLAYSPFKLLKIVAGGQANKVTGVDMKYSPRLAAVLQTKSGFGGKLLYGSAFRSATPGGEKAIDVTGVIRGNPNLLPEVVNTSEIQFFLVKKKFEASINYFYSDQSNKIVRTSTADPVNEIPNTPQFVNRGSQTSRGIEAETKFYISSRWSTLASFASQTSKNDLGYKDYSGTPLYMAKLGIDYKNSRGLQVGVFNSFYSKGGNIRAKFSSENVPSNFAGIPTDANPKMKTINFLTANVRLSLPEFLEKPDMPDITLFCYGVNLLDQQVYYPEFSRRNINTYPGRAGFNIHTGITVKM